MKTEEKLNMTMLCDFYELTMGNGYFESGYKDHITYFDVFFRKLPDSARGAAWWAGLGLPGHPPGAGWRRLCHRRWSGAAD